MNAYQKGQAAILGIDFGDIAKGVGGLAGGLAGGLLGTGKDKAGQPTPGQMAYIQQQAIAKALEDERRRKEEADAQMTKYLLMGLVGIVGIGTVVYLVKK
jgi:hypothetical protein